MSKKVVALFFIVLLTLAIAGPSTAAQAAGGPFKVDGKVSYIKDGTVKPAGGSGRFVVVERELGGALTGDLNGSFTLTYKGNVELSTQAGDLHGTMVTSGKVLNVNGRIQPLELVDTSLGIKLPKLSISGHWNLTSGAQGQGTFTAWAIFIPTPDGHVGSIVLSDLSLTGSHN